MLAQNSRLRGPYPSPHLAWAERHSRITSAAKPKSKATAPTSVVRLALGIVVRARVRVGVGESLCAGAMAAQNKRP
jgi:hypothetical protein